MRKKRRLLVSIGIALILWIVAATTVLALPASITVFNAVPTANTISYNWTKVAGSTKTMIRYLTTTFPTDPTGVLDSSIQVYFDTGTSYKQTGLTVGTTYYISAWSYDGANYSANPPFEFVVTTYAITTTAQSLVTPTLPSNMNQTPSSSTWFDNLQPFTGTVSAFVQDWGMPVNNGLMLFSTCVIVGIGFLIYSQTRNTFAAYACVLLGNFASIYIHLMAWWTAPALIAVGMGIWAVEHNFQ